LNVSFQPTGSTCSRLSQELARFSRTSRAREPERVTTRRVTLPAGSPMWLCFGG
jgi:hypothetical protein